MVRSRSRSTPARRMARAAVAVGAGLAIAPTVGACGSDASTQEIPRVINATRIVGPHTLLVAIGASGSDSRFSVTFRPTASGRTEVAAFARYPASFDSAVTSDLVGRCVRVVVPDGVDIANVKFERGLGQDQASIEAAGRSSLRRADVDDCPEAAVKVEG